MILEFENLPNTNRNLPLFVQEHIWIPKFFLLWSNRLNISHIVYSWIECQITQ